MHELKLTAVTGPARQLSNAPTRKVIAGGFAGALATIGVYVLNAYFLPPGKPLPAEIAAAITTVITAVISYYMPPAAADQIAPD